MQMSLELAEAWDKVLLPKALALASPSDALSTLQPVRHMTASNSTQRPPGLCRSSSLQAPCVPKVCAVTGMRQAALHQGI